MPQIFTASADTRLRLAVLILALSAFGLVFIGGESMGSTYSTGVGWVRDQPVPFSHKHHVSGLGIDCRFCHTGVETSARAGLPSTEICMTCHAQLWTNAALLAPVRESFASGTPIVWDRVTRVPDYVYFNHSIHVARGVPCEACHGRVDQMALMKQAEPFQMRWCLECHRDPAPHLRPPDEVTRMDWSDWNPNTPAHHAYAAARAAAFGLDPSKLDDCNMCHR